MMYAFLLFISAFFAYLLTPDFFPSFGLTIVFISFATLVFKYKKQRTHSDRLYYALTTAFALFITIRANEFLTFLDLLGVIFFGSLLTITSDERNSLGILRLLKLPLSVIIKLLITENKFVFNWNELIKAKTIEQKKLREITLSIFITGSILLLIIPLLSSANPLFGKWVTSFNSIFNITKLLNLIFGRDFPVYLMRAMLFAMFLFFIPRALSFVAMGKTNQTESQPVTLPFLLPKIVIAFVLFVFFISQMQLYLATDTTLKMLGMTHSQYAREVFGQLSVVALIILGLIYNDKNKERLSHILTFVLIAEGFFLTFAAFKSVYDYSSTFGLTFKRLYGYTGVIWIGGVFALFAHTYYKEMKYSVFLKGILLYSGIVLILINLLNFDYLIYHYAKSRTGQGVDHLYLSQNLSTDANALPSHMEEVYKELRKTPLSDQRRRDDLRWALEQLYYKGQYLQDKYEKIDFRSFNLSEYLQFVKMKYIKLQKYKTQLDLPL